MMKKIFMLIICVGLCSACAPATPIISAPVFDPNLSALQSQQTANAAQDQAQIFAQMATGTAQAPIIAITQTAADFAMQQAYAQATSTAAAQTQVAAYTSTAQSWTPTPNATTTAVFAQSYAEATQIANKAIEDNNRIERQKTNTVFYPVLLTVFFLAIAYAAITYSREKRQRPIERDENGKTKPVMDIVTGEYVDLNASPNYSHKDVSIAEQMFVQWMQKKYGFVPMRPQITAERQDSVKEREQVIEVERIRHIRLPKALVDAQALKFLPEPEAAYELEPGTHLALPPWEFINHWNGESRPLGFGSQGLITATAASPHLLVSGKTGTGKTGFMLRTQATASLAKGYQVVNLGFSDSGFGVFVGHPNYHTVKLDQASDLIPCLASVYKELKERKQLIGGASIEWDHWTNGNPPRPFVDLLIDELGNIAEDIYASEDSARNGAIKTRELWRWISMIANEGRKVGIRFVAALQDPTAKSVDLRFRRNCTLVSFQQGDASQSSAFLGATGAELLQVGHFMTRIESLVVGGGFSPSDDEIKAFLRQHAVAQTPAPAWIDGVVTDVPKELPQEQQDILPPPADSMSAWVLSLDAKDLKVVELYQAGGMSNAEIEELAYGYTNGRTARRAKSIIEQYRKLNGISEQNTTTTTTTTQISPNLRALAA